MGKTDGKGGEKTPSIRVRKEWKLEHGINVFVVYLRAMKSGQSLSGMFHVSAFDRIEDKSIDVAGEIAVRFASIPAGAPASSLSVTFNGDNGETATFTEPITVGVPVNLITFSTPVIQDYIDEATKELRLRVTVVGQRSSGFPANGTAIFLSVSGNLPVQLYLDPKGVASWSFENVQYGKAYDICVYNEDIGSQTWTVLIRNKYDQLEFDVKKDLGAEAFNLNVFVRELKTVKPAVGVSVNLQLGQGFIFTKITDDGGQACFQNCEYSVGAKTPYLVSVENCAKKHGHVERPGIDQAVQPALRPTSYFGAFVTTVIGMWSTVMKGDHHV